MTTPTSTTKKAPAKAAAKKAPAPAKKAAPTAKVPGLRWQVEGDDRSLAGKTVGQTATAGDRTYAIKPDGDSWLATVRVGRKSTTLSEGSYAKAYQSSIAHNRAAQA